MIGEHDQFYVLSRDGQFLLVNRLDVESADERELSYEEATGLVPIDIPASEWEAPAPVKQTRISYNRRLDEWYNDPDASSLQPMIIPKIARAGEITMLSGKWRDGKSSLMTWIVSELSRGGSILGESVEATTCHWVSFEEIPPLVISRFRASNPDPTRIHYLDGLMISPERTLTEFNDLLRTTEAKVVIVDSLSRLYMRGGEIISENDNAAWVRVLDELQRTVRETGVALVFLHHLSKQGDSRGGTAIPASMDCAVTMKPVSRTPRARKLEIRGRTIMDEVTIEKAISTNSFSIVTVDRKEPAELERRICEAVSASAKLSGSSVIHAVGAQKQLVLRAIRDLVAREVLVRVGRGASTYLEAGPNFATLIHTRSSDEK